MISQSKEQAGIWQRIQGYLYSYDGAGTGKKRSSPSSRIKSPDYALTPASRKQLQANTRDLQRNYATAAWALRRHIDYVATVSFEAETGNPDFDRKLEAWFENWSLAGNCDVAGRHNLQRMVRIAEARRTVDGDCFAVLMSSGHIQWIEADRVRNPRDIPLSQVDDWRHGIRTSRGGRVREVAIHERKPDGSYEHERNIRSKNVCQLGYFEEFDQRRGVSPLAPSLNSWVDLKESFDFALAKSKLSQLFAVAMYLGDDSPLKDDDDGGDIGLGNQVRLFDGGPDDKIDIIESKNPSSEFQAFTQLVTEMALKALDIPFSHHSENYSTFYGAKAAHIQYVKSCDAKRADIASMLDRLLRWRLSIALRNREMVLPRGLGLADLKWQWIHAHTPWWRPLEEVKADQMAVEARFKTRSQICRERLGMSFRDVCDRLAEEEEYMREKGLTPTQVDAAAFPETEGEIEPEEVDENKNPDDQDDDGDDQDD